MLGYPQNVIFFKALQSLLLWYIVEEKEERKGGSAKMARWRWSIVIGILLTLGLFCKYAPIFILQYLNLLMLQFESSTSSVRNWWTYHMKSLGKF